MLGTSVQQGLTTDALKDVEKVIIITSWIFLLQLKAEKAFKGHSVTLHFIHRREIEKSSIITVLYPQILPQQKKGDAIVVRHVPD